MIMLANDVINTMSGHISRGDKLNHSCEIKRMKFGEQLNCKYLKDKEVGGGLSEKAPVPLIISGISVERMDKIKFLCTAGQSIPS